MGLASSQARLLNLTARMHQIEYGAARLEAMKLQMANESKQVYNEYLDALEKTKVQVKTLNTDGSVTYVDIINYEEGFLGAGYAINFNGTVYDNSPAYTLKNNKSIYVSKTPIVVTADDLGSDYVPAPATDDDESGEAGEAGETTPAEPVAYVKPKYPNAQYPSFNPKEPGNYYQSLSSDAYFLEDEVDIPAAPAAGEEAEEVEEIVLDFARLCKDAFGAENPPVGKDVETVITNLINSGMVTIVNGEKLIGGGWTFKHEVDFDYADFESSVATNTGLQEVTDEIFLKKAEAKYEADMKRIDMKDRKYDHDLAALEAERNAIKQEMETLKTVSKDNVERTFKLFS